MNPPKFPLSRIIQEGTIGDCPFSFGESIGCIQSECENYYLNKSRMRKEKLKDLLK
jgi:hypothetical protein